MPVRFFWGCQLAMLSLSHVTCFFQQPNWSLSASHAVIRLSHCGLTGFSNFMFSATCPRGTRSPLRIGPRATRDSPELSRLVVGRQIILTIVFCYIGLDSDWYQLRQCCCYLFIFWHFPAAVPDPPVALQFGPDHFSDIGSISDDSG